MINIDIASITAMLSEQSPVILLESQSDDHPWSRNSYIAACPKAEITARGSQIHIKDGEGERTFRSDPWQALQVFRGRHNGWLFGYLGYDLKNFTEQLSSQNADAIGAPDLYFMVPGVILEQQRHIPGMHLIEGSLSGGVVKKAERNKARHDFKVQNLQPQCSREEYLESIREAQQAITDGDCYEINLSHQLRGQFHGSAFSLYKSMKKTGPVPFGAYIQTAGCTVCCQSPERFLRRKGPDVFTQPIKGTAQRGRNSRRDQRLKQQLAQSAKERAENLMIVDLARNDLNRIAEKGSVRVTRLFDIETFGTVHQMVSTIAAKAPETDPVHILKSCFPMGSMTGAPKISAMKKIEQLEDYRRGIYSGAIGYIKPNGDFDFNVVIRTAVIKGRELFYAAGGAVTGDSDPAAEWQETLVKSQALYKAIER